MITQWANEREREGGRERGRSRTSDRDGAVIDGSQEVCPNGCMCAMLVVFFCKLVVFDVVFAYERDVDRS